MSQVKLLYVEDDPSDIDLAATAMRDVGCDRFAMSTVADGEAAIDYLKKQGGFEGAATPNLVLLDLNLPKIHGRDVLKAIKSDGSLRQIPVVIISTSKHQNDVDETFQLGASGYFVKPSSYDDYKETFRVLCDYWGRKTALPR